MVATKTRTSTPAIGISYFHVLAVVCLVLASCGGLDARIADKSQIRVKRTLTRKAKRLPKSALSLTSELPTGRDAIVLTNYGWSCEPNVCSRRGQCGTNARVELLVRTADGSASWAPLCDVGDKLNATMKDRLAIVACKQFLDLGGGSGWQKSGGLFSILGGAEDPFIIPPTPGVPEDADGRTLFDPSKYSHWATITGWADTPPESVRHVQELPLQVSTSPCKPARLLAINCHPVRAGRHARR